MPLYIIWLHVYTYVAPHAHAGYMYMSIGQDPDPSHHPISSHNIHYHYFEATFTAMQFLTFQPLNLHFYAQDSFIRANTEVIHCPCQSLYCKLHSTLHNVFCHLLIISLPPCREKTTNKQSVLEVELFTAHIDLLGNLAIWNPGNLLVSLHNMLSRAIYSAKAIFSVSLSADIDMASLLGGVSSYHAYNSITHAHTMTFDLPTVELNW